MGNYVVTALSATLLSVSLAASAASATVGERHLVAHEASAVLRNAWHSDELRITIWYPAAPQAVEAPINVPKPCIDPCKTGCCCFLQRENRGHEFA